MAPKKIGFLSFGHWTDSYGSQVRTASDALLQAVELTDQHCGGNLGSMRICVGVDARSTNPLPAE